MKRILLIAAFAAISPLSYAANAVVEHCPEIKNVKQQGFIFTAPSNGTSDWVGIASSGAQGGITEFSGVDFLPLDKRGLKLGVVGACVYKLAGGQVAMRLKTEQGKELIARAVTHSNGWQKSSYFGQTVYRCESDPLKCTFQEKVPG